MKAPDCGADRRLAHCPRLCTIHIFLLPELPVHKSNVQRGLRQFFMRFTLCKLCSFMQPRGDYVTSSLRSDVASASPIISRLWTTLVHLSQAKKRILAIVRTETAAMPSVFWERLGELRLLRGVARIHCGWDGRLSLPSTTSTALADHRKEPRTHRRLSCSETKHESLTTFLGESCWACRRVATYHSGMR
jgi:hypothetical protein